MTSIGDNSTVVGDSSAAAKDFSSDLSPGLSPKDALNRSGYRKGKQAIGNDFISSTDYMAENRPFFVPIGKDGVLGALRKLDEQLLKSGQDSLLSKKKPVSWTGHELAPGNLGLIDHGSRPEILTRAGRYPKFPFRNWWARSWKGTKGVSDTVIEFMGLTIVQVSQNQAAVVSDPQNRVFVIKNSGFVAFSIEGSYDVLSVVDQTHLPGVIKDKITGLTLGWTHEVKMKSKVNEAQERDYVVALFMNIPANNCAILQKGDDLELLGAGQSVITNPSVTLRGLYTLGENQIELPTKDIYTRDQVPVTLTIYLKWQLIEPLKLTTHGYATPYDALRDKTQSILTQIVSHLDYASIVKQRSLGPDNLDDGTEPGAAFLDALRTRAMDDMHLAAQEYGIELRDLAVIDREFKGATAANMDKLVQRALQAQVEAANVDRENSNKIKQEEGALSVARIAAQARNTKSDAEAYSIIATAKAQAERTKIEAEANAESTRIAAEAETEAIRLKAEAYRKVEETGGQFAREMELRRMDVNKVKAYGSKTIFVPQEGLGAQMGGTMANGMAAMMGGKQH